MSEQERFDSRQRLHEVLCKVPSAKHEVRLESTEVVEKVEFIKECLEKPLAGDRVRDVYGPL
jgi:hypothetical protein